MDSSNIQGPINRSNHASEVQLAGNLESGKYIKAKSQDHFFCSYDADMRVNRDIMIGIVGALKSIERFNMPSEWHSSACVIMMMNSSVPSTTRSYVFA
jgi:hypothetical protein